MPIVKCQVEPDENSIKLKILKSILRLNESEQILTYLRIKKCIKKHVMVWLIATRDKDELVLLLIPNLIP